MNLKMNAHQLAQEIRDGNISAEDHIARLLEHIERINKKINAVVTINENALEEARRVDKDREGLLAGVPIAVKDNICTKGIRTTAASKMLEHFVPPYDATVITKLKREGAIIIGKTNMDEFGMGSSTEFSIFGPSRNPWDLSRVTGGSSGGSAAIVTALGSIIALGSDTGGSIRCPASFCSCVGLKPTYGLVSRYGLIAYANSMEIIGPLTRSVYDAALTLETIAGRDEHDNTTHNSKKYLDNIDAGIEGLKIALVKEMIDGVEEHVSKAIHSSLDKLANLGAEVDEISLPSIKYALAAYYTTAMAESSSNLARYDGIRYGISLEPEGIEWNRYYMLARRGFGAEVKRRIILGTYILSSGYYGKYYLKAQKVRSMIRRELLTIFNNYNILVSPTMPILPYKIGEKINDPLTLYLSDINTILANITGIPAISLPAAFKDGLPIGIQFMAKDDDEHTLLRTSYAFEEVNNIQGEPQL